MADDFDQCEQCGEWFTEGDFDWSLCESCAVEVQDDSDPWPECYTCGEGYHNPEDLNACTSCGAYPLVIE